MHSFTFAASVLATTFLSVANAAPAPAGPSGQLSTYYGQLGSDIESMCADPNVDIVPIAFVTHFAQTTGDYSRMNFASNGWASEFYVDANGKTWTDVFDNAHFFVNTIPKCQANGKKVLISLGGSPDRSDVTLQSTSHAQQVAAQLWKMFGPVGKDYVGPRPFGQIVIDGFDFDIEGSQASPYHADLAKAFKGYFATDKSKQYYLSAAPQCVYPVGQNVQDPLVTALSTGLFDYVFVQFYNNFCSADTYNTAGDYFTPSFKWWSAKLASYNANTKLFVGVPGGPGSTKNNVNLVSAKQIQDVVASVAKAPNFGGVMLWDYSTAAANNNFQAVCKKALGGPKPPVTTTTTTAIKTTTSSTTKSTTASTTKSTTASTTPSTTASTTKSTTASTTPSTTASTTKSTTASTTPSTTASTTKSTTASSTPSETPFTTTTSSEYVRPTTKSTTSEAQTTTTTSSEYVRPTTKSTSASETTTVTTETSSATTWSDYDVSSTTSSSKPVEPTTTASETGHTWSDYYSTTTSSKPVDATTISMIKDPTWSDLPVKDTTTSSTTTTANYWGDHPIKDTTTTSKADPTWSDVPVKDTTTTKVVDPTWSDVPVQDTTTTKVAHPTWSDSPIKDTTTTSAVAHPTWSDIPSKDTTTASYAYTWSDAPLPVDPTSATAHWSDYPHATSSTPVSPATTPVWSNIPVAPHTRYETVYVDEYVTECSCEEATSTPVSPVDGGSKPTSSWADASVPTSAASVPVSDYKPTKPAAPIATFTGAASKQVTGGMASAAVVALFALLL